MLRRKSNWLVWVGVLLCSYCQAADTAVALSGGSFMSIVKRFHPVVRQAGISVDIAKANIQQARGNFDPVFTTDFDKKAFDGKLYYSNLSPHLSIPTWYGIDLKAGIDDVDGSRLNPEVTTGQTSYLGVKVAASTLLFDSRRATLRQAQAMQNLTEAERTLIINDLLFDAMATYWNWVKDYQIYQLISNAVRVNEERMKFVRIEHKQGSRPAIDTVEALAQLQNFYMQQSAAFLSFQNSGLELSNFMWLENSTAFQWNTRIIPDSATINDFSGLQSRPNIDVLIADAMATHPKLQSIGFKREVLEIEQKLKAQYLIPKMSLSANMLQKGADIPKEVSTDYLNKNYKIGFDFNLPIFMRSARGAYRAAGLKLADNSLVRDQTALAIENKIRNYNNEFNSLKEQVQVFEAAYSNYYALFRGERIRFETGESTLFLLNSRENKLLESAQKLAELRAKWQKSFVAIYWAAGRLN
jgi:outer membrane protein TolC